jgi:hypothetical protein
VSILNSTLSRFFFHPERQVARCHWRPKALQIATSGKQAFGLDPLVPVSIWAGTKGPATSLQNRLAAQEALVPARNEPLVPVWDTNRD